MLDSLQFGLNDFVNILKAAGEPTRLRLLLLLSAGDLTVTDLTEILGQSQPRISRHLKLLSEADLIDRYQEGAWAYFRLRQQGEASAFARSFLKAAAKADPILSRDADRLAQVKRARAEKAQAYFSRNAAHWDELRSLHISEEEVERVLSETVGTRPVNSYLDLGTGTGRLLQLFDGRYRRAVGVDASRDMLAVARANIEKAGLAHASIRHGDIFNLPFENGQFDLVTIHQVLHFLDNPDVAIREAARMLSPGGRLVIVDFAPHGMEYLREEHQHMRLGFSHAAMNDWLVKAGLEVGKVIDLDPSHADSQTDGVTVTIWLARDRRIEIATSSGRQV